MSDFTIFPSMTIALAITAVFVVGLRPIARSIGLVDKPGGRKTHDGEVPIIGGIAMFVGMFAGLAILPDAIYALGPLAIASAIVVAIGAIDDRFHIAPAARVAAQIGAIMIMVFGAQLSLSAIGDPFGTGEIRMGPFTLIFTALVTLTMINAYNLIDGIDGLAGSLALIALLSLAIVAGVSHPGGVMALTVSAAIVGFLLFNLPMPWNRSVLTFMGDAGSTLLGFTIVWITLGVSQGEAGVISPVHCLWLASIPIYDTLTCFVRRIRKGKSPFVPGRDHFHHTLRRGGFGMRQSLGILTGLQAIYALLALLAHFAGISDVAMFAAWSVLGLLQRTGISYLARRRRHALWARRRAAA